ncbi:hypothetical protein DL93DRAFT_2102526 [Clavulina sp. PMI_390]|nr:hypothetical protein DL93DRAFT_2102526 [Clavulina sp. PMI_390]
MHWSMVRFFSGSFHIGPRKDIRGENARGASSLQELYTMLKFVGVHPGTLAISNRLLACSRPHNMYCGTLLNRKHTSAQCLSWSLPYKQPPLINLPPYFCTSSQQNNKTMDQYDKDFLNSINDWIHTNLAEIQNADDPGKGWEGLGDTVTRELAAYKDKTGRRVDLAAMAADGHKHLVELKCQANRSRDSYLFDLDFNKMTRATVKDWTTATKWAPGKTLPKDWKTWGNSTTRHIAYRRRKNEVIHIASRFKLEVPFMHDGVS